MKQYKDLYMKALKKDVVTCHVKQINKILILRMMNLVVISDKHILHHVYN